MKKIKDLNGKKYIVTIMMSVMLCCVTVFASSNASNHVEEKENELLIMQTNIEELSDRLVDLQSHIASLEVELSDMEELNSKTYVTQKEVSVFKEPNNQSQQFGTFKIGSVIKANIISEDGLWIETEQGYVETKNLVQLESARNIDAFVPYQEKKEEEKPQSNNVQNNTTQPNKEQQTQSNPVYNVAVKGKSGLTKADLDYILAGSPMKNCAEAVLSVEEKYNVNAFFTVSVAQAETQRGLTGTGKSKNNAFGITSTSGGYRTFNSLSDSVIEFGGMIERVYFSRGLDTVEKVHSIYTSSPNWSTNVKKIMNDTLAKIKKK